MEHSSVKALTSRQECAEAILHLVQSVEQRIAIFSQRLEPLLYNNQEICEQISLLARKNRHSDIRIISQNTRSVIADGHCLIQLAQRLSSSIQIRIPNTPELQRFSESWLIIDQHSICQIDNPERYEGSLIEHNREHLKTKLDFFNLAWENSLPDPNSRRLQI